MKKKIAVVVQRYGEEVNGGAEYYSKKLAEHLLSIYDVDVLTTTARDYDTWKSYYAEGKDRIQNVEIIRFPVERERSRMRFRVLKLLMLILPSILKTKLEMLWLREQGPYCPQLIKYIQMHKDEYYRFVFVTYLYYPTVMGIAEVYEKSILVPTAHDEYCIRFDMYREVFCRPRGIVYLTEEEKEFVERLFRNSSVPNVVAGSGIDIPQHVDVEYNENPYLIYVGRVDRGKNCHRMFQYFQKYKKRYPGDLKLVVVGKMMMQRPNTKDIVCLGFVSEEKKQSLMQGARALILPSHYESLSLAVLESFAMGIPVLVDGKCDVLKNHCKKSGAGYVYENYSSFENCILRLFDANDAYSNMKICGRKYVRENYTWKCTIEKYERLIGG